MIKKIIEKLYFKYIIDDLVQVDAIDEGDRIEAYSMLYTNVKMMKVLQRILVADTKEMMKDFKNKENADIRYGMFKRTKAIMDKATELYKQNTKEELINK